MKPEHEKLLSQLFVTYDITDGIKEQNFGFVRLRANPIIPGNIDLCDVKDFRGLYTEAYLSVAEFEDGFEAFLKKVLTSRFKLSDRERLDSIEFDLLGMGRIRAPGPIGILACHPEPGEFLARRPIVLQGRFEVVK